MNLVTPAMKSFAFFLPLLLIIFIVQSSALDYKNGKSYKYFYETSVFFNELEKKPLPLTQKDVGVSLAVHFEVISVFQGSNSQLLQIKLTSAKAVNAMRQTEARQMGSLLKYPLYFELEDDHVEKVFMLEADSVFSTNIKKGIASLFQVKDEPGSRSEIDVSGECNAVYSKNGSASIVKTTQDCKNLEIMGQYSNSNKMLSVTVWGKTTLAYDFNGGVIKSVTGKNQVASYLSLLTSINSGVIARQTLTLQEIVDNSVSLSASSTEEAVQLIEKEYGTSMIMTLLPSSSEVQECFENCETPAKLTKAFQDDLTNDKVAKLASAKAVVKLLGTFRNAGKNLITEVLTNPKSSEIVSQLIDVTTATQTLAAQNAILELLDFKDENSAGHAQRFLLGAAFSTHPGEFLVKMLVDALGKKIATESLKESLFLSTGAVVHTFCQAHDHCKKKVVEEFQNLVIDQIKNCKEEACLLAPLQALGNAGLPSTVDFLLQQAETAKSTMVATTALSSLRRMPASAFTSQVQAALFRMFAQLTKKYDSSVRGAALELLLKHNPSRQLVEAIILSGLDQDQHEFSTYVLSKLFDRAKVDSALRELLAAVKKSTKLFNYYFLAQRGKSSAFTSYLAQTQDTNCTYSLRFENSKSGVMKNSGMTVSLLGKAWQQAFMNFAIFADGLESMVGNTDDSKSTGSSQDESAEVEPTAGMSLTIMDVLLTQIEFFQGTGGLMSAVWNAPSELTSALQGNLLLQDHYQQVHLSNGLIIDIRVTGIASIDLSGYISISLWNRNCESLIKNSGAFYVLGSVKLASRELLAGMTYSGEAESIIDFNSDADFYEMPVKLCLQMSRPEFKFVQRVERFSRLKGLKGHKILRRTSKIIPGSSFFLNQRNSEVCKVMKAES